MEFRYDISPRSLQRWLAFERISAIQSIRGRRTGQVAIGRIVDDELAAIERATLRDHCVGSSMRKAKK